MRDSPLPLLLLPLTKTVIEIRVTHVGADWVLVVQGKTSVALMLEFPTVVTTVNMMTAMEEVEAGMELVEAQVLRNSQVGENMEVEGEGLGTEAAVIVVEVVVEQKFKMEAAAVALVPAPGDAMGARR